VTGGFPLCCPGRARTTGGRRSDRGRSFVRVVFWGDASSEPGKDLRFRVRSFKPLNGLCASFGNRRRSQNRPSAHLPNNCRLLRARPNSRFTEDRKLSGAVRPLFLKTPQRSGTAAIAVILPPQPSTPAPHLVRCTTGRLAVRVSIGAGGDLVAERSFDIRHTPTDHCRKSLGCNGLSAWRDRAYPVRVALCAEYACDKSLGCAAPLFHHSRSAISSPYR